MLNKDERDLEDIALEEIGYSREELDKLREE